MLRVDTYSIEVGGFACLDKPVIEIDGRKMSGIGFNYFATHYGDQ